MKKGGYTLKITSTVIPATELCLSCCTNCPSAQLQRRWKMPCSVRALCATFCPRLPITFRLSWLSGQMAGFSGWMPTPASCWRKSTFLLSSSSDIYRGALIKRCLLLNPSRTSSCLNWGRRTAPFNPLCCTWLFSPRSLSAWWACWLSSARQIFENNISDATVSQGFLITMHSDGHVKLFNLEEIVKKYRLKDLSLGQACEWNKTCGVVGAKPFGIPCNIDIKACPTVLFTVKCLENQLHIGGFPWHYIISLNQRKQKGKFRVFSLANESPSLNSVLDMQSVALESDWILFHPDDSGRILHVGPRQIDVLCIKTNELAQGPRHQIEKQFTIDTKEDDQNEPEVFVTSSGRVVKKRFRRFDDDPERETVHVVDHREEVDLLVVTCVRPGDAGSIVTVKFHDNYNGRLIKSVPLSEPWDVTYDQSLCLHADTIVQITQNHNRSYSCHVHKMFNTEVLEEEERERKEREGRKRKKSTRERKEPRP
uniref:DDB1- and CUL4-associated factor 17 isoform X2 n=1 Tax=Petromyzon marinus TaxID=7757 RepID=A0AAJ7WLI8_PETMA|nr:DDB1- and CUL4-associated factor 17 isoform X2 [Petromyzon marinus]